MNLKPAVALCLGALMLLPGHSLAASGVVACAGVHFLRGGGTEARTTLINLRNLDLVHETTVERITIRNVFGEVVHESTAADRNHPLNTDFTPALDITTVPAGASYYIATNHIWPEGFIPPKDGVDRSASGQNLTVTVEYSKEGKAALFVVGGISRTRENFSNRAERARDATQCTYFKPRDDD